MTLEERIEHWRAYCKILAAELEETAPIAFMRGWRSTRFKAGEEARRLLGINQHCEDVVHDECAGDCEQCMLEIEGFCPEDCEHCLEEEGESE